ncbi:MAG: hypothetical protein ACFFE5_02375 [Candidatus Thorarchaeota archaeon]
MANLNFITCYIIIVAFFGSAMITLYLKKFKGLSFDIWRPEAAWIRALIYFSICNIIIAASGTLEQIIIQPIFTIEHVTNPSWIIYCSICFTYIFLAYWILWSRMTLTFDRRYYLGSEIIFGVLWGFSTGGILLTFYHLWSLTGVVEGVKYLLSFISMGIWQYFIQDYFWDIYVSPEHDTPKSIKIKTIVCHIPNIAICLGFLTIWDNYAIYVSLQTFALIASTIFQKFPAPWAKGDFHAPMIKSGIFGRPRGKGYIEDN